MPRILAVWLPNWPIQRLLYDKPALRRRPVILQHRTRRGLCVLACSHAARRQGVQAGLPIAEATAVMLAVDSRAGREALRSAVAGQSAGQPAELHVETHDLRKDQAAIRKLAIWCHRFSPLVGLEESPAPDTLLLNVTGVIPLVGDEGTLLEQVMRSFRQHGLEVRLGVAETVGAAWALAHFQPAGELDANEPCRSETRLRQLPLAALRLPAEMVDILMRLGLCQVGQLLELPRVELESRFGPQLLRRLDQAFGKVAELIQPVQPPLDFMVEWLFEYPMPQRRAVEQVLRRLVEQLCFALADQGRGALRLRGRIRCQDADPVTWEVGLFRPSADQEHLWRLVETHFDRLPLPGPATSVVVRATQHERLRTRQRELFDQQQRNIDSPQIANLIDCLASQLGAAAVVQCLPRHDAQPERAFRNVPLVDAGKGGRKGPVSEVACGPLDRPLQLVHPPLLLDTVSAASDGSPVSFHYLGGRHDVARHWGPERIETGWWRQRGVRRDYYRVETREGRRFWLFYCLQERRWHLHGVFQ